MSDFWLRKMRTYFQRIDFDKDGAITRADFEGMADRFIGSGKVKDEHKDSLKNSLCGVWDKYLSTFCGGKGVNQESFVEAMKKNVKDPALGETLKGPLPLFFKAVDANEDGSIDQGEYALFFEILGLDTAMAPSSFQAIDTDNDGQLSIKEFESAGLEFFTSEEQGKPSKLFWGPMVD